MGQEEGKKEDYLPSPPQLPILPRLDRLDRLLQFLEDKHSNSFTKKRMGAEEEEEEEWCSIKPLSSVLEEVHIKGTLLQRLELLEFRVLQLSLEMDADYTSRSSSSSLNIVVGPADEEKHQETIFTQDLQEGSNGYAGTAQEKAIQKGKRRCKNRHKKWLGLFQMGCNSYN